MAVAVLGANGQLGRDLVPRLAGPVVPLGRADADLTDPAGLRAVLERHRPSVVVNCAAYNLVDRAENEPEAAFRVNAFGVRDLAGICRDLGAVLVHFSTDYVFGLDADRTTPWAETDAPGPVSVYGSSKLAGEYFVRSICPGHLVVRTCGLYGRHGVGGKGTNFVETMLRLAGQGRPLRVVADQVCAPSYTVDVAETTAALLAAGARGLVHVVNPCGCNWFEFARTIFQMAAVTADLTPTSTAEYGAPAARPRYSVLSVEGLSRHGIAAPRRWDDALLDYLNSRTVPE